MKILICGILLFLWNQNFVVSHRFKNKDPAFCGLFPNFSSTETTPILPFQDVSWRFLSDQIATPKNHLQALGFQDTSCVRRYDWTPKTYYQKTIHLGSYDCKTIGMVLRYTVYHFTNQAVHDLGGGFKYVDFYPYLGNDPIWLIFVPMGGNHQPDHFTNNASPIWCLMLVLMVAGITSPSPGFQNKTQGGTLTTTFPSIVENFGSKVGI